MIFSSISRDKLGFILLLITPILSNLFLIGFTDLKTARFARMVSIFLFFLFYVKNRKNVNIWIFLALSLFLLRDVFLQFYEEPWGYKLYLVFGILCYFSIILERLPKLSSIKFKPGFVLIALFLIAVNTYALYVVLHMNVITSTFHDAFEPFLFYIYGGAMFILGIQAISYNNIYNSQRSLFYTFFVFGFIASDITSLFAYYFGFEMFYFFDRFFFLTAFGIFVNYGLKYEGVKEEVNQFEMIDKN